jgi:hypothetical protein
VKLNIEIPDDWIKDHHQWSWSQLLSCSQCEYKTPSPALFVTHMFVVHASSQIDPESTLTIDK